MEANHPRADRLLLVEDDPSDADLIRRCLMAAGVLAVDFSWMPTLAQATAHLAKVETDLVLLDLGLPDSSGLDTLRRIIATAPETPVVVLTGHDTKELGMSCIAAGAQDYLGKTGLTPDSLSRGIGFCLHRVHESHAKQSRQAEQKNSVLTPFPAETSVTRALAGAAPIQERDPAAFHTLQNRYQELLDLYMMHIAKKGGKPKDEMEILATSLGDLGATPRDLIDVHTATLDDLKRNFRKHLIYSYAADSRLFALEMMGMLVEYYRIGIRRLFKGGTPT